MMYGARTGRLLGAAIALLVLASSAQAQVQRGSVYGTVVDNTGAVLPGVAVTLSGENIATQETTSGPRGEFRFAELDPGRYTVQANLAGFAPYRRENVIVAVGSNVELTVQLSVGGVQETVTVEATTPLIDSRSQGHSTNFDQAVLNEIPTSRDPWVLLQQVPGVVLDRVNVGGSESGQQSIFSARGDDGTNTMWNVDGVTITDPAAIGSSPTYYDFNAFEEVQFTTSGADPRQQTGALGINFVTKRGTNSFNGTGRLYFTNDDLQGENIPDEYAAFNFRGNRIKQIAEYGGDVGGPILKDRAWFWGAAAKNDIRGIVISGYPDDTQLTNYSAKIDAQLTQPNRFNFFYYRGEKTKQGRGAGDTRPPETTWNQGGPTSIYKFEDSHVFGPRLFLSGKFAYVDGQFFLSPQGGLDTPAYIDLAEGGRAHGSYLDYATVRPQYQTNVDGNYFAGAHEIKFGFQYRHTPVTSHTAWPGGNFTYAITGLDIFGLPPGFGWAELTREGNQDSVLKTTSFYVGDVITTGDWTFNLGLRFDRQNGTNEPATNAANGLFPELVPALDYPGGGPDYTWNDFSPRVGVTYRLSDKTIVRGSYSRFAEQLRSAYITFNNPSAAAGIEYYFIDENGDGVPQRAEVLPGSFTGSSYNIFPDDPTSIVSPNQVDPDFSAPITHSIIGGVEHQLLPDFAVGVSAGWGYITNTAWAPYIGVTSADFVQYTTAGTASGSFAIDSSTPVFRVRPGAALSEGNGQLLTNREGYHQRYYNVDFTATKRLSNRWMFRGFLTLQNHQEYFDDPALSIQDPTPRWITSSPTGNAITSSAYQDGGIVLNAAGLTSGSKADVFLHSKWSYSLLGLYELPAGFSVSGTLYGRQGYPSPAYVVVNRNFANGGLGSGTGVLVNPDVDATRLPAVHLLDLRLQKVFTFAQGTNLTIDVDLFNALNSNEVLQENRQANSGTFLRPREIIAPRLLRFGARIRF
jgi:hypothetical protein